MSSSYQFSPSKIPISESQYRSSSRTPNKYLDSNNGSTSKKPTYLARSEVVYSPEKTQFLSRLHDSTHVVDRELGAIKNQMENEHRRNVDTLLRSSAAIDRRNDELENVLRRLNLEIVAAKTHGSNSLKDKDLQRALGDKLNVSRIEKIKNDTAQKMDQVQF